MHYWGTPYNSIYDKIAISSCDYFINTKMCVVISMDGYPLAGCRWKSISTIRVLSCTKNWYEFISKILETASNQNL